MPTKPRFREKTKTCSELFELVGFLLRRDLTKQNADLETHRCRGYVANFRVAVFRGKKRERRRVTLENPESASLKKVCGSYTRICARYPPLARVSGRKAQNDLLV